MRFTFVIYICTNKENNYYANKVVLFIITFIWTFLEMIFSINFEDWFYERVRMFTNVQVATWITCR